MKYFAKLVQHRPEGLLLRLMLLLAAGVILTAGTHVLPVQAAEPVMVKDIGMSGTVSSYPGYLTDVNGTLFFFVYEYDDDSGEGDFFSELWKSDGTADGTVLVKDIKSEAYCDDLINMNGTLFFSADDGTDGCELWKSDGTEAGTVMLKGIRLGADGSYPSDLINMNGTLFFTADDGTHGYELWKSDGTQAGTVMVKDIRLGTDGSCSYPSNLINVNGTLFFAADDGTHGKELWKSDGTEAGTVLVKDIRPGAGSLYWESPGSFADVNGTLFFTADDGTHGYELWKSDGTEAGTVLVKDIRPGASSLYYWDSPGSFADVNGTLFFTADDGTHGRELWKSDGTEAGTVMVKDICPGAASLIGEYDRVFFSNVNGTLFFRANDGTHGRELWKSDGTEAGTVMVKDIRLGTDGSYPSDLINMNGTLFFRTDDGTHGRELWKSDGTEAGTVMVKDIRSGDCGSLPSDFINMNGILFFSAYDDTHGDELWKSDGTEAGTVLVKDIRSGGIPYNFSSIEANGTLFFSADDGTHGYELWKSDGAEAGAVMVKDIRPGADSSFDWETPDSFTNVNGTLFFAADDGAHGYELWKSDGTEAGTVMVRDISPGTDDSYPLNFINVNGTLFFRADDGTHGDELWKTDGTEAGTVLLKDIRPGTDSSYPSNLINVNGTLFFSAADDELWKSDGTETGTVLLKDINPGSGGSNLSGFTDVNGTLFFAATDGMCCTELWKSDGTEAGTVLVKDIMTGYYILSELADVNGTLLFLADDGVHGWELWKSDGTEAGTLMVKDIRPGADSSILGLDIFFKKVKGMLYFGADDGVHGNELWQSDGTEAGTVIVKDIRLDRGGSYPSGLISVNRTLFFGAADDTYGYELWMMTTDKVPGDVDGNGAIDLRDAATVLKILAGMQPEGIYADADTDGDGKIGFAELGYILKKLSE